MTATRIGNFLIYLTLVCTIFIVSNAYSVPSKCFSFYSNLEWSNKPELIEIIRTSWHVANFSDPKLHRDKEYRYIVSHIGWKGSVEENAEKARSIAKRLNISTSLISNEHRKTFGGPINKSGFILKVPAKNIKFSSPKDFAWGWPDEPRGGTLANPELYGLDTPAHLIKESIRGGHYNEVTVDGTVGDSIIEVSAIYFSIRNNPNYASEIGFLKELASTLKVPLIELSIDRP